VPTVDAGGGADFLAGLIAMEGTMIALIDLPNLLAAGTEAGNLIEQLTVSAATKS